ncbi:MAG: hypothetical protein ACR2KB_01335 [Chitinophagaceae bacterium]
MFNFFKKGKVYTRLANIFYAMNCALKEVIETSGSYYDIKWEIFTLVYSAKRGVLDKMGKYEISFLDKIYVQDIGFVTVADAWDRTVSRAIQIARDNSLEVEVKEILEKGPLYFEIENSQPESAWKHLDY